MFSKVIIAADNVCPKAHSNEELEEWHERHRYRQMKLLKAKQQNLFSFMNEIQDEYASTDSEIDVVSTMTVFMSFYHTSRRIMRFRLSRPMHKINFRSISGVSRVTH